MWHFILKVPCAMRSPVLLFENDCISSQKEYFAFLDESMGGRAVEEVGVCHDTVLPSCPSKEIDQVIRMISVYGSKMS